MTEATTTAIHSDLGTALDNHRQEGLLRRAKGRGPAARNQSSAIGWPCPSGPRYLTLLRTVQPEPTSPELQAIFEEGDAQETVVAAQLIRDGWSLIESENPNKVWPDLQISGRIDREATIPTVVADALGLDPRTRYIAEIKSMAGPSFDKSTSIEAMMTARQPWLRGYGAQLTMYLWLEERAAGIFVLKSKQTGALRFLPMHMDDWVGLAANLVELARAANAHIAAGTLPEVTGYEDAVCSRCRVRSACLPGEQGIGANVILNDDMADLLLRREELSPLAKEYDGIDAQIKSSVKAIAKDQSCSGVYHPNNDMWICADWLITVKQSQRHMKALPERDTVATTVTIRRAKGG